MNERERLNFDLGLQMLERIAQTRLGVRCCRGRVKGTCIQVLIDILSLIEVNSSCYAPTSVYIRVSCLFCA